VGVLMRGLGLLVLVAMLALGSACSAVTGKPVSAPPPPVLSSATPTPAAHPLVMPNLIGLSWIDAEPRLRDLGWTGVLVKGPYVARSGVVPSRIAVQDPPAGAVLGSDSPITVSFAV